MARKAVDEAEGSAELKGTARLLESLRDLGEAYQENGDRAKAILTYEKCLHMRESRYGSDDVRSEPLIIRLAALYQDTNGAGSRRRELLEQLQKIRRLVLPESSSDVLVPLLELAQLQMKQDRFNDAANNLIAIGDANKTVRHESDSAAYFYLQAGICKRNCAKLADSEKLFNEALELYHKRNRSPEISACYYFLALSSSEAGKTGAAAENFERCLTERKRLGPSIFV